MIPIDTSDPNLAARFLEKCHEEVSGCWVWHAARTEGGYGVISLPGGAHTTAHRVAYSLFVGPIPDGLQIDHRCRNRGCVNPDHLEPVTNQENTLRGERGRMVTHCIRGHEYTADNTVSRTNGRRQCLLCRRVKDRGRRDAAFWRAYRQKRKERGNGV